jgi:hypothetical protein
MGDLRRVREPAIMFRLPRHVISNLDQLAERIGVSSNIIAKLIVTREVTRIPAMLDEHDRQLANIHRFLREIAFHNEDFLDGNMFLAGEAILIRLKDVMAALDAMRDASFVRPSGFVAELVRSNDGGPT